MNINLPSLLLTPAIRSDRIKKRKRDDNSGHLGESSSDLRVDRSFLSSESLNPIKVLERAQVPLSAIAPTSIIRRCFERPIQCLEDQIIPLVLLATAESGALVIIEKYHDRTYVICDLATHVTIDDFTAFSSKKDRIKEGNVYAYTDKNWWLSAVIPHQPCNTNSPRKTPRLDMLISREDERDISVDVKATDNHLFSDSINPSPIDQSTISIDEALVAESPITSVDLDQLFASFIQDYLNMLYRSKTSVAYFAKVHIARLRTGTSSTPGGSEKLKDFLNGLLLSCSNSDKKYKTVWPRRIEQCSGSAIADGPDIQRNRARKKKLRLIHDKKNLLLDESEMFMLWWNEGNDLVVNAVETTEERLKRRTLQLRTRESFLQIIIMLEIMHIEADGRQLNPTPAIIEYENPKLGESLDLLLDRLCIWHSLNHSTMELQASPTERQAEKAADQLRDFCTEVILPFYCHKLPKPVALINSKFGVPIGPTQLRRQRSRREKTTSVGSDLIGSSGKRRVEAKPLPPSLHRASTDSQIIIRASRESSQHPFDQSKNLASGPSKVKNITTAVDKNKLRQREVDFDMMSQKQVVKQKKQTEVDMKLKEAISALQKPNRSLAGKELADVAEQRELMAKARTKAVNAQKDRYNLRTEATPNHTSSHHVHAVFQTPMKRLHISEAQMSGAETYSKVADSVVQFRIDDMASAVPDTGHRPRFTMVDSTPLSFNQAMGYRAPVSQSWNGVGSNENLEQSILPETPLKFRDQKIDKVKATPLEASKVDQVPFTPSKFNEERSNNHVDIYDALGWDE